MIIVENWENVEKSTKKKVAITFTSVITTGGIYIFPGFFPVQTCLLIKQAYCIFICDL